jgi:hypothetical protein
MIPTVQLDKPTAATSRMGATPRPYLAVPQDLIDKRMAENELKEMK